MLLERQVRDAQRTLAKLDSKARPTQMMERDIIVVWGLYRGWTAGFTAKNARVHPATIRRRRAFYAANPAALFELPILHRGLRVYRCEFCGSHIPTKSERAAREHVAEHVLSPEIVKSLGVTV